MGHGSRARGLRESARALLSIALVDDEPPTEFRLFASGENPTTKGTFLFDDAAAASVMAEYERHGIDLMVDYDHASLASAPVDPALAGKAAAWFGLEVREGELWATNVRWTPPAAEALRRKEWRFMSPAFAHANNRVTAILNVAITNMPAMRNLEPLMAASAKTSTALAARGGHMDPKIIGDAMAALIKGDAKKCMAILQSVIISAAGGNAEAPEPADAPAPEPPPEMSAIAAASSKLMTLTSATGFADAVTVVETFRTSHLELEAGRKKLAEDRVILEAARRRKRGADLVTLGGRNPSEVWADDTATSLKPYLESMPAEAFEALVADAIKANAKKVPAARPPTDDSVAELSARELSMCVEMKIDPKDYVAQKANSKKAKG
jgi:phage I-like protein